MADAPITLEKLQQLITRGPFNRWLNFTVIKIDAGGIEVKATWREEWVVNPDRRYTHGGNKLVTFRKKQFYFMPPFAKI